MSKIFIRTRQTWLAYSMLAFYSYYINIIGPVTPFFKDELHLSYTVSSLHYTAFAAGILVVGLFGNRVIQRIGRKRALYTGAIGLSLGALALVAGWTPFLTIPAAFMMGCIGSLIMAIVPIMLSDQYGEQRAVAISEVNMISSITGAMGPFLVGYFARTSLGWRMALACMVLAPILIWLAMGRSKSKAQTSVAQPPAERATPVKRRLPGLYWAYWIGIVLVVSAEFCMISWGADYFEKGLGMLKANAAQVVSLFMISMIVGRLAASRLVQRFSSRLLVSGAILLALAGFLIFWLTSSTVVAMVGLFVTGLGIAGLYPLIISMALSAAGEASVEGGARATLASGTAILTLPLVLGRLADIVGIHLAYSVVIALLIAAFVLIQVAGAMKTRARRGELESMGLETGD
jgi:fucose permease